MICVLVYFTQIMVLPEESKDPSWFSGPANHVALRALIMIFSVFLVLMEFMQFAHYRTHYVTDPWNMLQLATYVVNFSVVYYHSSGAQYDVMDLSRAASLGAFSMWFTVFSWMRLFH
jgi:hypothetical protein